MLERLADHWYFRTITLNWERVFPSPIITLLVVTSIVVLWVIGRRKRTLRFLALYSVVFLCLYFCPPAVFVLRKMLRAGRVFWRVFWIFPWSMLIAAAAVQLSARLKDRFLKAAIVAMTAVLVVIAGNQVYIGNDRAYQKANNLEKIPAEACETVAMIYENEGVAEKASVRIAVPLDMAPYIRQIDGTITMPYGRTLNAPLSAETPEDRLFYCLWGDETYKPAILDLLRENGCRYVVVCSDQDYDKYLQEGARLIGETGRYELWERTA